ncbi:SEC31-like protein B, COPII coat complex component [Rhinolophus ferrumequinum]|uniref:SEC31-like protein B, COPII coat complex component n=1 Tax=Rhinolophus ferrumequinum TaxID=59479 RepID=A0A7J7UYH9_RHIFE|nr:SEC31-like protein B, COPII coat complex component [Rhinolophus ferrumequinum]
MPHPVMEREKQDLVFTGQTMKLKELERPAVQVWSPALQYPVYLAAGTSAQQLDASFSTNGTLEIFEVDFRDPSLDLKRRGVLSASSSRSGQSHVIEKRHTSLDPDYLISL